MDADIEKLIAQIRQVAYDLHVYLGTGLLEKVYENGLRHRLEQAGLRVESQKPLRVYDSDGFCLGEYFADLVVEGNVIVELKAVSCIANEHYAQILNYLKITGAPAGLLINFGSYKFEVRTVVPRSNVEKGRVEVVEECRRERPCRSVEVVEECRREKPCRSVEM